MNAVRTIRVLIVPCFAGFIAAVALIVFTLGMCARGEVWNNEHRLLPVFLRLPLNAALAIRPHLLFLATIVGFSIAALVLAFKKSRTTD